MADNVVWLTNKNAPWDPLVRIDSVVAIFRAIDAAELLAATPQCEVAQAQYRTAISLLSLAERELSALRDDVASLREEVATAAQH